MFDWVLNTPATVFILRSVHIQSWIHDPGKILDEKLYKNS